MPWTQAGMVRREPRPSAPDRPPFHRLLPLEDPIASKSMAKKFERHRQPWTPSEIAKLHLMVGKGLSLKAIAQSLTRSEESVKTRAKIDKLNISKMR